MPDLHIITNKNCWTKSYDARILGVASNNDQNADRWSNTKENGGTEWIDGYQYYQKKIDTNCYADRYSDLKAAFGDNRILRNHYFSSGIEEGRDPTCDTTQPVNSKKGYYADKDQNYSNQFDTINSVGFKGCKDAVKAKGFEVWGIRTDPISKYTVLGIKRVLW